MKPLEPSDLLDLTAYERARDAFRAEVMAHKRRRRIAVGPELTFIFEDRLTVRFQVQEMLRTERIVDEGKIQGELDVYNELIPRANSLSATLMIEIPDRDRIREMLDRLVGIDEHVLLEIGGGELRASFDAKQFEADRISAVQYVQFTLGPELARSFADPSVPATLRVDHPACSYATALTGEVRASLIRDLAD
ncbi:MAG: DUF3501 family protein [Deltaproteobacteria bacterium]|nr:DUF3501 family protein [Deltaproteobacteria bacterium]MBW2416305.1 DUF3501 family protein [Deltaproteobacteria bacterium]